MGKYSATINIDQDVAMNIAIGAEGVYCNWNLQANDIGEAKRANGIDKPHCSCNIFSSKAIPCRHIIALLTFFGKTELSSSLVYDRWKMIDGKSVQNSLPMPLSTINNELNLL